MLSTPVSTYNKSGQINARWKGYLLARDANIQEGQVMQWWIQMNGGAEWGRSKRQKNRPFDSPFGNIPTQWPWLPNPPPLLLLQSSV